MKGVCVYVCAHQSTLGLICTVFGFTVNLLDGRLLEGYCRFVFFFFAFFFFIFESVPRALPWKNLILSAGRLKAQIKKRFVLAQLCASVLKSGEEWEGIKDESKTQRARECWVENKPPSGREPAFAVRWNGRTGGALIPSRFCLFSQSQRRFALLYGEARTRWRWNMQQTLHPHCPDHNATQHCSVCREVARLTALSTIKNTLIWCCGRHISWLVYIGVIWQWPDDGVSGSD